MVLGDDECVIIIGGKNGSLSLSLPLFFKCSQKASACCEESTCNYAPAGTICLKGDSDIVGGGCQKDSECPGDSANCPPAPKEEDGTPCNENKNTCFDGACTGQ